MRASDALLAMNFGERGSRPRIPQCQGVGERTEQTAGPSRQTARILDGHGAGRRQYHRLGHVSCCPRSLAPYGSNAVMGWSISDRRRAVPRVRPRGLSRRGRRRRIHMHTCEQAFGPAVGFIVTWSYWISIWVGECGDRDRRRQLSFGRARFRRSIESVPSAPSLQLADLALHADQLHGRRVAGGVIQLMTTVIKLVPLVAVSCLRSWLFGPAAARHRATVPAPITAARSPPRPRYLVRVLGFETATAPVGKIRDPERTVPRATIAGTLVVGLYLLCSPARACCCCSRRDRRHVARPFADVRPPCGPAARGAHRRCSP